MHTRASPWQSNTKVSLSSWTPIPCKTCRNIMFCEPSFPMNHPKWGSKFQTGIKRGKTGWYTQHHTNQTTPASLGNQAEILSLLRLLLKEKVLGGQGFAPLTHKHRNTLPGTQKHLSVESLSAGTQPWACPQQAAGKCCCESSWQLTGIWQPGQEASCSCDSPS